MKKLSKDDIKRLFDLDVHLMACAAAIESFNNNELTEVVAEYNGLIQAYNERLEEARGVLEDFVSEMDEYMGDRSERWLESDAGRAYSEWKGAIENVSADLESLDELGEIEVPDFCVSLEDSVPQEPSS